MVPNGRVMVLLPERVRTGGVVSTVNGSDAVEEVFPAGSFCVTVAVYFPSASGVVGVIVQLPDALTVPVRVCPLIVSVIVAPTSPVPENVGVLSMRVLPLPGVRRVGTVGGVVSRVTVTVPVAVFPDGSAIVRVGLLVRILPVHETVPVVFAGVGEHVRPGIVSVAPDSVPVQVTVVAPLVVDGDAVQVGTVGGVVSRVTVTVPVAVFPDGSAIVRVGLLVRIVPVHRTLPVASAGVGEQVRPGIVRVAPDSVPVQVTVVAPLVVDGDAVQVGIAGGVVSTTLTTREIEPVFPATST